MTDAVQIALIAAIAGLPATLVGWLTLRESRKSTQKVEEAKLQVQEVAAKTSLVEAKTTEIATKTDGHLSQLTEELRTANATILEMQKLVTALVDKDILVRQAKATVVAARVKSKVKATKL